ncbi:MAG: hypothetical protein A3C11_00265 [Candidatus Sungbacteria bacterium RIFCSPHIGHO2_02_FULL_49_12]|uniref:Uncharacterized protein n=1 Tax=Candidatus Sungbacteria bacterium RIFCSPHIGHO2_02_FULL_49_12 TaxID=1802271 RepID=A0A1G2KU13_9BACT|nr:MAG: hypothetical protein A3C11_00265 [Candidatus Sungbacteria bacterium RIFCSPHIGHO2_02_FULL_49_12]
MLEVSAHPLELHKSGQNIRTMKSDVSEFLASTKPSLIKLLSTQMEEERGGASRAHLGIGQNYAGKIGAVLVVLVSVGVVALGGYIGYRALQKPPLQQENVLIPQALFQVGSSETTQLASTNTGTLSPKLISAAGSFDQGATMKRLIILKEDNGTVRSITASEFLTAADIQAPAIVSKTFSAPIMPVFYKSANGTRLALIAPTSDPDRVRAELLKNEPSLAFDWSTIFLNQKPVISITALYEDRIYRNISYRRVIFDPSHDNGIVYGIFPAKNYFIITTSDETFKIIINRLYESS